MDIRYVIFFLIHLVNVFSSEVYRCPTNVPRNRYLKTYRDSCYQFVNNEKYWTDARDDCSSRGGLLVQIRDLSTQNFVYGSLRELQWNRNGVWLGAHDLDSEGTWKWVTGEPLTYNNWDTDQPGGCKFFFFCPEDCANMRLDAGGRWHDYPCSSLNYVYSYVCQYAMGPATTTTSTTTKTTTTTLPSTTLSSTSQAISTTKQTTITSTELSSTTKPTTHYTTTTIKPTTTPEEITSPTMTTSDETTAFTHLTKTEQPRINTSHIPAVNAEGQNSQQLNHPESTAMYTGAIVGVVATLSFLFGIVVALILKRKRRNDKTHTSIGFDNVAYSAHGFTRSCSTESNAYSVGFENSVLGGYTRSCSAESNTYAIVGEVVCNRSNTVPSDIVCNRSNTAPSDIVCNRSDIIQEHDTTLKSDLRYNTGVSDYSNVFNNADSYSRYETFLRTNK